MRGCACKRVLGSKVRGFSDASAQKSFCAECAPVFQPSCRAARRRVLRSGQDLAVPEDLTVDHRIEVPWAFPLLRVGSREVSWKVRDPNSG